MVLKCEITAEDKKTSKRKDLENNPVVKSVKRELANKNLDNKFSSIILYPDLGIYFINGAKATKIYLPNEVEMFAIEYESGKNARCIKFELDISEAL